MHSTNCATALVKEDVVSMALDYLKKTQAAAVIVVTNNNNNHHHHQDKSISKLGLKAIICCLPGSYLINPVYE